MHDSESGKIHEDDIFGGHVTDSDDENDSDVGFDDEESNAANGSSRRRFDVESEGDTTSDLMTTKPDGGANAGRTAGGSSAAASATSFGRDAFSKRDLPSSSSAANLSSGAAGSQQQAGRLNEELQGLKRKKRELEDTISSCTNQALALRFKATLDTVEAELKLKQQELDSLSMLFR